jgi:hypothetical protein
MLLANRGMMPTGSEPVPPRGAFWNLPPTSNRNDPICFGRRLWLDVHQFTL